MDAAELIADALMRAELCSADVRTAALLWISRVQIIVSPEWAQRTLDAGLAASHGLPDTQPLGFEELSRFAVAAVAPERLSQLPPTPSRSMFHSVPDRLARVMSEHGHENYLRIYVLQDATLADVPLDGIGYLLAKARDDEERRLLLRRAAEVWRAKKRNLRPGAPPNRFRSLFRAWWKILPRAEALTPLREIIDRVLEKPDSGVHGQIGNARFTSIHALEIFQSFDLLSELDQECAQRVVGAHPELATALGRYPRGLQSIEEEAEAERAKMPARDPNQRGGFIMGGGQEDFDYGRVLIEALNTGDFAKPLEYAAARYRDDSDPENPNEAPKAFWPSGAMYRTIFYQMGKTSGQAAELKLDSVPDSELRLFAQIELAAALGGLPKLASMSQRMPRQRPGPIRNR